MNEDIDTAAAELELLSGLVRPTGTGWDLARWQQILGTLPPRFRRVVILTVLHEMPQTVIGERLGVSRGRVQQMWVAALGRLKGRVLTRES